MRYIFLAVAVWDTIILIINMVVLPKLVAKEALVYMNLRSQLFPIAVCLFLYVLTYEKIRKGLYKVIHLLFR